jgi:DHA2 family multidrug resistance protein
MSDIAKLWVGFAAMCIGMFMAILDIQVVASSLVTIEAALRISADKISWIQTAYLIAEVIAIPLTGWLTRMLSLRLLFASATVGFTLASLACAFSAGFGPLIVARVVQGFCGGMLIPSVFTSIFSLIPEPRRVAATAIAGTFAMIAPTIGPAVGGFLTETFSWRWIFHVNIAPGIIVSAMSFYFLPRRKPNWQQLREIDYATIALAALFLATLELLLKEAPKRGWHGEFVTMVALICAVSGAAGLAQCLRTRFPFVDLRRFRELSFSLGCALSFIFGMGLYGSVYLLSIFLGGVRDHTPLEIGEIMMVSGAAQLLTAPIAAALETRIDARLLTVAGFGLFGAGLFANGFETVHTDFSELFWPQVLRGVSVMLCILPATRLALDHLSEDDVPDASALFNLMRNLGGAIGIAVIDTVLEQRTPGHVADLVARLEAGDPNTARVVGLPVQLFHNRSMGPIDPVTKSLVEPLVRKAALVYSFNEAWLLIAGLFAVSLLMVPLIRPASALGQRKSSVDEPPRRKDAKAVAQTR